MPKSKNMKKKVKRNKKYPPLSKEDKFLYTLFDKTIQYNLIMTETNSCMCIYFSVFNKLS